MMKKQLMIWMALGMSAAGMAQKATAENQQKILDKTVRIEHKTDSLVHMVEQLNLRMKTMETLYGSSMDMDNDLVKASYAFGISIGENMRNQGITELDITALNKGLIDGLTHSNNPKMSLAEAQQFLNSYVGELMAEQARKKSEENEKWLAENAKKPGVKVTESGLQYEVLREGSGQSPTAKSKVTVHYHGTLRDGTVFDSSVERGKPATFPLNQVIKGWTEGVQLMKPGAKYRFYIPSHLAYGERGAGEAIGPNEILIFEIELISVE
ncbi:MAG: hypothetical protein Kow0075_04610 [Salibacteraceae bacterium]